MWLPEKRRTTRLPARNRKNGRLHGAFRSPHPPPNHERTIRLPRSANGPRHHQPSKQSSAHHPRNHTRHAGRRPAAEARGIARPSSTHAAHPRTTTRSVSAQFSIKQAYNSAKKKRKSKQNNKKTRNFNPEELICSSRARGGSCTEVTPRIHGRIVNSHFIVKVRPGRTPALAFQTNNIAALHMRAHMRAESRKMPVPGAHTKSVVNHYQLAVSRVLIHHRDDSVRRRVYRIAIM